MANDCREGARLRSVLFLLLIAGWLLQASDRGPAVNSGWRVQADSLYHLGLSFSNKRDDSTAVVHYGRALKLYHENRGEPDQLLALLYNDMAYSYGNIYVPYYALDYFRKAVEIWESIDLDDKGVDNLISGYQNLAFELVVYGDLEEAAAVRTRMNNRFYRHYHPDGVPNRSHVYYLKSRNMHLLGNVRVLSARGYLQEAYGYVDTMHRELDDLGIVLAAYKTLFDDAYEHKQDSLAIAFAEEALQLANAHDSDFYRLVCYAKLASIYDRLEKHDRALVYAINAEQAMVFESFSASKYAVQTIKAMILADMKRWDGAQQTVEQAMLEIIHHQADTTVSIATLQPDDLGDLSSYTFIRVFTQSARVLYDCFRHDGQRETFEKAVSLYRAAAGMFNRYYLKGEYNDYVDDLHLQIIEGLLAIAIDDPARAVDCLNLIERNASQHLISAFDKKLRVQQAHDNPFDPATFDIGAVMTALGKGDVLLKYHVAQEHVYLTAIERSRLTTTRLGTVAVIKPLVLRYAEELRGLTPNYTALADSLRQLLLGPVHGAFTTVIPDNFLNYLPFESLYDAASERFIGETHTFSYAYSLPFWLLHRGVPRAPSGTVKAGVFAPHYQGEHLVHERQHLHALHHAQEEAVQVANILGGDPFLGDRAAKQTFLDRRADYDIFHFAMHSFFYEDDFQQSCLVFSGAEKLYFSELYGLDIPARMAVLSACHTGNGKLVKGEGIMSLSRAFTYAGVASTVMSLWQAPDKETAEIMQLFYAGLRQGMAKSDALAAAKRTFIKQHPMKRHPYFWAGLVVNGDDSPLLSREGYGWIWWMLGAVCLATLGVLLWRRHGQGLRFSANRPTTP